MTIFVLFFIELLVMRTGAFQSEPKHDEDDGGDAYGRSPDDVISVGGSYPGKNGVPMRERTASTVSAPARGEDHLGHSRHHTDSEEIKADAERLRNHNPAHGQPHSHGDGHGHGGHGGGIEALTGGSAHSHGVEDYAAQMTAIFVLEFGIIFHSIFIGLTLAVTSAADFNVLYVVLVFHQTFEGLGLGTRLAITPWGRGRRRRWTPYVLALAYSFSTPVATAVGLGLRTTYAPGGQTARVVNGVFDSISAGILIYTGLVELMAHEFMFSETMRRSSFRVMVSAFGVMCAGAGTSCVPSSFSPLPLSHLVHWRVASLDHTSRQMSEVSFCVLTSMCAAGLMALLGKWA